MTKEQITINKVCLACKWEGDDFVCAQKVCCELADKYKVEISVGFTDNELAYICYRPIDLERRSEN